MIEQPISSVGPLINVRVPACEFDMTHVRFLNVHHPSQGDVHLATGSTFPDLGWCKVGRFRLGQQHLAYCTI